MAVRNIVVEGDPLLRERSRSVTSFDDRLSVLLDDMVETMKHADGVGLAAPQVGILRQVCVISIDDGQTVYELINPVIRKASGEQIGYEGCLSVPGVRSKVKRPRKMTVSFQDRKGRQLEMKAEGFLAVVFSHEIDHLNGILFIDKAIKSSEKSAERRSDADDYVPV